MKNTGSNIKIAVASGKGGTGKTSLSVALLETLPGNATLLDCDVEEPNCAIFFEDRNRGDQLPVTKAVPKVDEALCTGCGVCADFCQFNAIISLGGSTAMVFAEMCHSCGGCATLCPAGAIEEVPSEIGTIFRDKITEEKSIITGSLAVGQAMAPPVIRRVIDESKNFPGPYIIDAPPGTACSFVTAVHGADYVVLVTEATPFGLHDLELAVAVVREMGKPFGVVINRIRSLENLVTEYCSKEDINVLLQIEDDRTIAEFYSNGKSMVQAKPELKSSLLGMYETIIETASEV